MNKKKMCFDKVSFFTHGDAHKRACKYDGRVYECPVCFCFHVTSEAEPKLIVRADHLKALRVLEENKNIEKNLLRKEMNVRIRMLEKALSMVKKKLTKEGYEPPAYIINALQYNSKPPEDKQ